MTEVWKNIKGYEDSHQVSNLGNIRTLDRTLKDRLGRKKFFKGKLLKKNTTKIGYECISLNKNGLQLTKLVHRLVAETFILNPKNLPQVNHIDCIKNNNHVNNLEWVSPLENNLHAIENNLRKNFKKINQYDLNNNLINTYSSQRDAFNKTGICYKQINACLKNKQKTAHNYIWKFKDV